MSDSDPLLAKREVERDVFGSHGFNYGPLMISTNPKILLGLGRIFAAAGIFGYGIWLTISSSVFSAVAQWLIAGMLTLIGIWAIHIVLIEAYSSGAASGFEASLNTIEQINAEEKADD